MTSVPTIAKYQLLTELGGGASGVVYKAHDPTLDRLVALKVLRPHMVRNPAARNQFVGEAQKVAKLAHPGIATVYELGEHQGTPFIAYQFIDGPSLERLVRERGQLLLGEVVSIVAQVAGALDACAEVGLVHGDVKSANILLDQNGRAYLTDFGIAQLVRGPHQGIAVPSGGTLRYMAPEQMRQEPVTPLTDVYGLGVVAYEALAGRTPFEGDNAMHLAFATTTLSIPPLSGVLAPVAQVIYRALAKAPEQRWPSAGVFAARLAEAAHASAGTLSPVSPVAVTPTVNSGDNRAARGLALPAAAALMVVAVIGLWMQSLRNTTALPAHSAAPAGMETAATSAFENAASHTIGSAVLLSGDTAPTSDSVATDTPAALPTTPGLTGRPTLSGRPADGTPVPSPVEPPPVELANVVSLQSPTGVRTCQSGPLHFDYAPNISTFQVRACPGAGCQPSSVVVSTGYVPSQSGEWAWAVFDANGNQVSGIAAFTWSCEEDSDNDRDRSSQETPRSTIPSPVSTSPPATDPPPAPTNSLPLYDYRQLAGKLSANRQHYRRGFAARQSRSQFARGNDLVIAPDEI